MSGKETLNMDRSQPCVIHSAAMDWEDSPAVGVQRKKLEREAAEIGQVSSIVRYAPGASFSAHQHPMGEEVFVLEGVFEDEHGSYPAGSYLRNPPDSSHTPKSPQGCVLFVKLNQFDAGDMGAVRSLPEDQHWLQGQGRLQVLPLHDFGGEHTALVKWPADEQFQPHRHFGGEEILVLDGVFRDEHGNYETGSWLRSPHMSAHNPFTKSEGALILVKVGHMPPESNI